jgi:HD-GYP domain-containing protein (c-di-GMP phosphodiesterase class II)
MQTTPVVVANLKIGMFVAELDRPWSETPFLTDGFRIVEADQLEVLRAYCRRVFIDPLRSSPESLSHLGDLRGKKNQADWDEGTPFEPALSRIFPEWKGRSASAISMWQGMAARVRHFVDQRVLSAIGKGRVTRRAGSRSPAVPRGMTLWVYRDVRGAKGEVSRARPLFQHTERLLAALLIEVSAGKPVELKALSDAADGMVKSVIANPQPLLWLAMIRTLGAKPTSHAMKVAVQLLAFGRSLGFDTVPLKRLAMIGLLIDVGKARVNPSILKKPEALNPEELAEVRRHVELGLEALGGHDTLEDDTYRGISEYHERLDGSGYPKGLKGDEIGLFGRMAAIVDSFATLITRRSYAPAMSALDAMRVLYAGADAGFSKQLIEDFLAALGIYPIGSLVELASGEIGMVLAQTPAHQLRPRLLLLTDADKLPRPARPIDLLSNPVDRNDHVMRIERGLPYGAYNIDPRRFQLG